MQKMSNVNLITCQANKFNHAIISYDFISFT